MADVVKFPKKYTSYRVSFLPYEGSPFVSFAMQVAIDKLDEFLEYLFAMPLGDVEYFEVHGMLADGTVEVLRGDIRRSEPKGRINIKHSATISPGTTAADKFRESSLRYIAEKTQKRKPYKPATPLPATPAGPASDSQKPRVRWDPATATHKSIETGHTISESQWAEMKAMRNRFTTNRPLALVDKKEDTPDRSVFKPVLNVHLTIKEFK